MRVVNCVQLTFQSPFDTNGVLYHIAPKGGTREYRNGPWYKTVFGKKQGDRLGKKKKYGHGPYADKKSRFTTIEQHVSAIRKLTTMP